MRTVTDHVVEQDAAKQLTISVVDEPGQGGANHHYEISWNGGFSDNVQIRFQLAVELATELRDRIAAWIEALDGTLKGGAK